MPRGELRTINGPLLAVRADEPGFFVSELVKVGPKALLGEVIALRTHRVIVQLFEDPGGLSPGIEVIGTGAPLSVNLRPGLLGNIFDGIGRPLRVERQLNGKILTYLPQKSKETLTDVFFPSRNGNCDEPRWQTKILVKPGQEINAGDIFAEVDETSAITYRAMVPTDVFGIIESCVPDGRYTAEFPLVTVATQNGPVDLNLTQEWPIRVARPIANRLSPGNPLITGQRVIDSLFPVSKGGTAAIPGGFGTGKTMTQHQIAKWADADIIIYIGCGERGNEMTEVLEDFGKLTDPRTGKPLLARTILIANTSDMPVAAREASIFTGMTLAECYRDMGYHVALMADSTSRWAEALREISGRLEEMPAEEGYPAYLASRLGGFYERAGYVETLCGAEGSITVVGAVSPQGADFSEPVTQNTKRFVRCFWALDKQLAYARHFPAIDWMNSYTGYLGDLEEWYTKNAGPDFPKLREKILNLLQEESNLLEIAKLIGSDTLPDRERLTLALARVIRLGFAQQNAYHPSDVYTPLPKQKTMMEIILYLCKTCHKLLDDGVEMDRIQKEGIFERVIAVKYKETNTEDEMRDGYFGEIDMFRDRLLGAG